MAEVNGKASSPVREQKVTPERAGAKDQMERGTTWDEVEVYTTPRGEGGEDGIRIQRLRRTRTVCEM